MIIGHIDDILPHIEGRKDFVRAVRDGYQVVDYVFEAPDTFAHPARLECRGIKFDAAGKILARPFAKFFNIGQKEHTQPHLVDLSRPHVIMEKLDGSMIHPAILHRGAPGERLVLMTRMGHTDVARKAEALLTRELMVACVDLLASGYTPIFEFTAPDNRIVIRYEQPELHLLGVRHTINGHYMAQDQVEHVARRMQVKPVEVHASIWTSAHEFVAFARAIAGREGFVVRFLDGGLMLKMKGDDYVTKHAAKDGIALEKNALAVILDGGLDDVLPLLDGADRGAVEAYAAAVELGIAATANVVAGIVESGADLDQKSFAVEHLAAVDPILKPLCFQVRKGADARSAVVAMTRKHLTAQTGVDFIRPLFGARWEG